jgi:hypothetical protein
MTTAREETTPDAAPPEGAGVSTVPPPLPPEEAGPVLRRRVLGLAWPVIGENMLETLLDIVNTVLVAGLGAAAVAGVGSGLQIMFFVLAALSALSVGNSILVAQAVGARDLERAGRLARQSLLWSVLFSVPLALVGFGLAGRLIGVFGLAPEVARIGVDYLRVAMGTVVVLVALVIGGGVLRGAGDSRTPMVVTAIANVVNVVLAYGLIYGHAGLPALAPSAAPGRRSPRARLPWSPAARPVEGPQRRPDRGRRGKGVAAGPGRGPAGAPARCAGLGRADPGLGGVPGADDPGGAPGNGRARGAAHLVIGAVVLVPAGIGFGIAATALVGQSVGAGRPGAAAGAGGRGHHLGGDLDERDRRAGLRLRGPDHAPLHGRPRRGPDRRGRPARGGAGAAVLGGRHGAVGALRGTGDTRFPLIIGAAGIWSAVLVAWLGLRLAGGGLATVWAAFLVTSPITAFLTWRRFRGRLRELESEAAPCRPPSRPPAGMR